MEPQNTNQDQFSTQPTNNAMPPVQPQQSSKKIWIIIGSIIAVIALPFIIFAIIGSILNGGGTGSGNNPVFFEALSNASQKNTVKQHTSFKLWDEGKAMSTTPKDDHLSLTEFNTTDKKFNTINASSDSSNGAEKCLDAKPYRYDVSEPSLAASIAVLNNLNAKELAYANPNGPYSPCNIESSRRVGKYSDGIIPVGLTTEQSLSWINYLKNREVFNLKDEGTTDHKGKKVRKISFTLNDKLDSSALFYAVRDGDKGAAGSGINWEILFGRQLSMNLSTATGMTGFYLIDEAAKLPVYSSVSSAQLPSKDAASLPSFSQKAEYEYPEKLSITRDTKLTILD